MYGVASKFDMYSRCKLSATGMQPYIRRRTPANIDASLSHCPVSIEKWYFCHPDETRNGRKVRYKERNGRETAVAEEGMNGQPDIRLMN